MNTAQRTDRIIVAVLVVLAIGIVAWVGLAGRERPTDATPAKEGPVKVADYDGRTIGILSGTNMEAVSFEFFPNSDYLYFNDYPDLNAALESHIIDAYLGDEPAIRMIHLSRPQIDYIRERLTNNRYSFAFRKDDAAELALRNQFNAFLKEIKDNGVYDEIDSTWFGTDESKKVVSMDGLTGANGTLHMAVTSTDEPFCYMKDGAYVGYDIDVAVRFCREAGYALKISDMDYPARIPAIESGMCEFTTTMNVTPEREEQVLFSDPVSEGGIVCAVRAEELADDARTADVASFDGRRAGVITGSFHDSVVEECLPDSEVFNYDTYTDLLEALRSDRIDYFLASSEVASSLMASDAGITALSEPVKMLQIGAMFPKTEKGDRLREQMDAFITDSRADGTLGEVYQRWDGSSEDETPIDLSDLPADNGTLRFATSGTKPPITFQMGDRIAGSDPDIAVRFCRAYGYGIDVSTVQTAGLIDGIATGVFDFALSDMVITDERKESVNFSIPYRQTELLLVTRAADAHVTGAGGEAEGEAQKGLLERLWQSFEKNFIREDRWKLILQGTYTTCLITVLSVLFGGLLGFGICVFRRTGSRLANLISDIFVRLLQGTPTVVLLMILYYVVFGPMGLAGVWVAVIGFTLNFAAYGSEIMRAGIDAVSPGQREAALALGYSEHQAFHDFVFPQAAVNFMPVLRGEIVNLLKATAVVGYIAVQDLTKMSDIIRSRTYEAFFPLIATALIYFLLAWLIARGMSFALSRIDPRGRRHTDKGRRPRTDAAEAHAADRREA